MPDLQGDIWSRWLLEKRFGGDEKQMQAVLKLLYPVRDKILARASLRDGDIMLDLGCGDGLIAFGALNDTKDVSVIFNDISKDLLDYARAVAQDVGVLNRCQFLQASVESLAPLGDSSIDVVTARSVLIYVQGKQKALSECYRVLKPGGRLSIFEPINSFGYPEPEHMFGGYNITPVIELARKVKTAYLRLQPPETDPMFDFDERDLLNYVEQAGFQEIHLELQIEVISVSDNMSWDTYFRVAANPKIPTLEEAIQQALTAIEAEQFIAYLRQQVETAQRVERSALAYLWATKK